MKNRYIITVITSILMVVLIAGIQKIILEKKESRFVRVGALYVGDSSNTYTGNFIKAQKAIEIIEQMDEQLSTYHKSELEKYI